MEHSNASLLKRHAPTNWRVLNIAELSTITVGADDVEKTAYIVDDGTGEPTTYVLTNYDPPTWKPSVSGTGGGGGTSELPAYSTSEVLTAERWIDGKPVYRKVVSMGALPNATTKSIAHGISNLDEHLGLSGVAFHANGDTRIPLPYVSTSNGTIQMHIGKTNVIVTNRIDMSVTYNKSYAIIYYTKTTDTALSPVALIGGGSGSTENITTDVEYIVPQIIDGKQVYGIRINCGALPNEAIKTIDIPSYATSYTYWFKEGFALNPTTGDTRILPFVHYSATTNQISLFLDQGTSNTVGTVQIATSLDYSSWDGIITLHYTK